MSEYKFLKLIHSWLKLAAWFFCLAIVVTKQCWYCSQKFHGYALSLLHTASSHNYTKMNSAFDCDVQQKTAFSYKIQHWQLF